MNAKNARKKRKKPNVKIVSIIHPSDPALVLGTGPSGVGSFLCSGNVPAEPGYFVATVHGKCFPWPNNTTPPTIPTDPDSSCTLCTSVINNQYDFGHLGGANYSSASPYPKNTVAVWYLYRNSTSEKKTREIKDFGGKKAQ